LALADALLERDELTGADVRDLLALNGAVGPGATPWQEIVTG
jgi:hypothetical protein